METSNASYWFCWEICTHIMQVCIIDVIGYKQQKLFEINEIHCNLDKYGKPVVGIFISVCL